MLSIAPPRRGLSDYASGRLQTRMLLWRNDTLIRLDRLSHVGAAATIGEGFIER